MYKMTSQERFKRMFEHRDADRVPIIDSPWFETIERWNKEGMPQGMDFVDYFDLDQFFRFEVDNSPRYEAKTIEETEEYRIYTTAFGVTMKQWKHSTSTPEFLDFKIQTSEAWLDAKKRMVPTRDRINWEQLKKDYKTYKEKGAWTEILLWFGFDITHSWFIGTENLLVAMLEEPEWCMDMFNHFLEVNIALWELVLNEGYEFDSVFWYDDMGYKNSQFFSLNTYREVLKPFHKRAIDWAHSKGMKTRLHSCGDVNPFIPELVGLGLDALNPLEVKAGMNPIEVKQKYGKDLVLNGGINAVLWDKPEAIEAEMKKVIPVVKENGGYIFSSDHSVPPSVSLENFRRITDMAKKLGSY
jgi:uroporphyrinogen decarboxylase